MPDLVTTKPMRSRAQWRFLFGTGKPFAKRWARATPGGKGTRYQKLPIKVKAPNYGARAGQTIGGRLVRGNDGKFASGGGAAPAAKPKRKPKVKPVKPKVTPEQRAAAREQERIARRDAVLAQLGIDPGASEALVMLSNGEQPDPAALARMGASEAGLVEQAADGSYRMTPAGRQMLNAAERGDKGLAGDVISRARDRIAAQAEKPVKPAAAGGGGGGKKKPEKPPKLPARQTSAGVKPVSGGGAAKPPTEKPEAKPTTDPALAALAQRLSAGEELSQDEQDTLIRNGLARMVRGEIVLTMAGQRAIRTKAIAPTRTTDAGHTGVMVAFYPDQTAAKAIASADGVTEPVEQLHLTLCFLGDSTEQPLATNKDRLIDAVAQWATEKGQALKGVVNGLGRFFHSESDGTNAVYVAPDVPGLPELRQSMAEWIEASGFDYSHDHGFTPHITVAYVPEDAPTPPIRVETPISFDRVTLAWGDEQYDFAMGAATKSFAVYKDTAGRLRWVAYSSNAYRDRDEEIVSTKALTEDCARADAAKAYGPLRWWHVPGWELGDCDFNAMHGRVLVESGTFKSDSIGRAVAAKAAQLQLSIGFTHAPDEPDRSGVFHHIQRFERSLVPSGRAANPFTKLSVVKESDMDNEKETALKGVLGEEVATQVIAGAEQVQKDADDRQTAFKSADDPWAAVLTTLKAAVATMVAPPAPEPVVEKAIEDIPAEPEAKAEDMMVEETVVEPVAEDPGEMTYDEFVQAIRAVVREELAAELKAQIAPLAGMLDIEKKVSGAVQSLMQPYQAQKDASDAERAEEIATLKAKIAELEGEQPAAWRAPWGGYRASADDATIATKEQVDGLDLPPLDADPEWTKIQKHLIGNGHLTS